MTAYDHLFLITEKDFDTKDNDFIRYKLLFRNSQSPERESGSQHSGREA